MDYATEILKDSSYQGLVAEIEALETDRIYCRHGMAHVMDVCRLSWNLCLEDVCLQQVSTRMRRKNPSCKNGTDVRLCKKIDQNYFSKEEIGFKGLSDESGRNHLTVEFVEVEANQTNLTVEFMETFRDRMYVVGLLHDIGRGVQYKTGEHHAQAGARLADEILTRIHYPKAWKEQTVEIIRDHCGRKSKISKVEAWASLKEDAEDEKMANCECNSGNAGYLLAYYIQRADHLSRLCFCCKAADTCKWTNEERNQKFI